MAADQGGSAAGISAPLIFLCLLFVSAVVCSARTTVFLSEEQTRTMAVSAEPEEIIFEGRSLKMINLDDYASAGANDGHTPRKPKSGGGRSRRP